jgi:hypothetical protein
MAFGQQWAWTEAVWDPRTFTFLDDLGLAALPFSSYDEKAGRVGNWLQLASVDLEQGTLLARPAVETMGSVRRTIGVNDRLFTFGDVALHVVNIADRSHPFQSAALELARDVADVAVAFGHRVALLAGGPEGQATAELRRLDGAGVDERNLKGLSLPLTNGRLVPLNRRQLAVIGEGIEGEGTNHAVVGETRAGDGTQLVMVEIAASDAASISSTARRPQCSAATGEATVLPPPSIVSTLRLPLRNVGDVAVTPGGFSLAGRDASTNALTLAHVTADERGHFAVRRMVSLGELEFEKLFADGSKVYLSVRHPAESVEAKRIGGPTSLVEARYALYVLDVAHPARAILHGPISVPGPILAAHRAAHHSVIYAADFFRSKDGRDPVRGLTSLRLFENVGLAMLLDLIEIPDDASDVVVDGQAAFYSRADWDSTGTPHTDLSAVDLSAPLWLHPAGEIKVDDFGYGYLGTVEDGRAYVHGSTGLVSLVDTRAPEAMRGAGSVYAPGWYSDRVIAHGREAYLPAGMYGIHFVGRRCVTALEAPP